MKIAEMKTSIGMEEKAENVKKNGCKCEAKKGKRCARGRERRQEQARRYSNGRTGGNRSKGI